MEEDEEEVHQMDLLSKTPPMTQRFMRRERSRTITGRPPHRLPSSNSSPNLSTYSTAVNSLKAKHDKKMQRLKSDRSAMRSLKHSPLSFDAPDPQKAPSPSDLGPPRSPFIDTTKQYRSLASHQIGPGSPTLQASKPVKKLSATGPIVPEERRKFHRTFALLIRMGNKGDTKSSGHNDDDERSHFQTRWPEVLWLELQACFNMISIDQQDTQLLEAREVVKDVYNSIMNFKFICSNQQFDRKCAKPCLLKSLYGCQNGTNDCKETDGGCESANPQKPSSSFIGRRSRIESTGSHKSFCLPLEDALDSYTADTQKAWHIISDLLKELELVEALYPTTKALIEEYREMGSIEFIERVRVLQLWMNLTKEIGQQLSVAEEALGVEDQKVPWPYIGCYDDNFPVSDGRQFQERAFRLGDPPKIIGPNDIVESSGPDVSPIKGALVHRNGDDGRGLRRGRSVTFSCGSDSDEEGDVSQVVRERLQFEDLEEEEGEAFSGPDSPVSSTPSKANSQEGDSPRVNRIFSQCHFSFDYDSLTSIYRPFVDRNLKHSGLCKMTDRLHHMLGETNRKLRLALEKPQDGIDRASYMRGISEVSQTKVFHGGEIFIRFFEGGGGGVLEAESSHCSGSESLLLVIVDVIPWF